jgi:hypothetical protein
VSVLFPVPTGMSILGVVTAAHLSAPETGPKMDPGVTLGDTLIAYGGTGLGHGRQIVKVITGSSAHCPPLITLVARNVAGYKST